MDEWTHGWIDESTDSCVRAPCDKHVALQVRFCVGDLEMKLAARVESQALAGGGDDARVQQRPAV